MKIQRVELVRVRPTGPARHGDAPPPVESPLPGWVLAPPGDADAEDGDRAQRVDADLLAYGPVDADVAATDMVRVPSGPYAGLWEVTGRPRVYASPYVGARASGTVIALRRTEG